MTTSPRTSRQTALVTGGLGFVGSTLVTALAERGVAVRVLDSLLPQFGGSPRHLNGVRERVEVVIEDTRNRDAVNTAVQGVDTIFHLAAPPGPGATSGDYLTDLDVACLGTWHLLEAMRVYAPGSRLVFASSAHVYAPPGGSPVREDAPTDPDTLFGAHQLAAEKYLGAYRQMHGLDTVVARLTTVYGPRQRLQSGTYGSVARTLESVLQDEDVPVYAGGRQLCDYLYVADAVEALLAIAESRDRAYSIVNVGSGSGIPVRAMVQAVIAAAGRGRIRDVGEASSREAGALHDFVPDVARLRSLGVVAPRRSLEECLVETVNWYRSRRVDL